MGLINIRDSIIDNQEMEVKMPARKKRDSLPLLGTVFTREYKGKIRQAKVVDVDSENGRVKLEVEGIIYDSPTAAARSFVRNQVDGWIWWHMDQDK
jgi:ribosomal protein L2